MAQVGRRTPSQQIFREVNENIAGLSAELEVEAHAFFCECSQSGCGEMVDVPSGVYGQVRSDPSHYLVRPGHQDPAQEEILENLGDYLIVQGARPAVAEVRADD